MPYAARITDAQACPVHGPPPVSTGSTTVFVGYMPAGRVTDNIACVPPDLITKGASNVVINNRHAARITDPTGHGGMISQGCLTVVIGETAQSQTLRMAAASGKPFCEECEKARKAAERLKENERAMPPPDSMGEPEAKAIVPPKADPKRFEPTAAEVKLAKSPGDSPPQRAAREKVVRDFYEKSGLPQARADSDMGVGGMPPRANGHPLGFGIDLSAPLKVIDLPDTAHQHIRKEGHPGIYFDPLGHQTGDQMGLNTDGAFRDKVMFKLPPGKGLLSSAGPVAETWTDPDKAILTAGGGVQLTVPFHIAKGCTPMFIAGGAPK